MADLAITAASVRGVGSNTLPAAAALTAGEVVYQDSINKAALANSGAAGTAKVAGVTLNGASADQPVQIHKSGQITLNAVLTAGTFYYLSATDGMICPLADLAAGDRVIQIGYAISTTVLVVNIVDTGITL